MIFWLLTEPQILKAITFIFRETSFRKMPNTSVPFQVLVAVLTQVQERISEKSHQVER